MSPFLRRVKRGAMVGMAAAVLVVGIICIVIALIAIGALLLQYSGGMV